MEYHFDGYDGIRELVAEAAEQIAILAVTVPDASEELRNKLLQNLLGYLSLASGVKYYLQLVDESRGIYHLVPETLCLKVWVIPGSANAEDVAEVLTALSAMHRAAGGSGLRFDVDPQGWVRITPRLE